MRRFFRALTMCMLASAVAASPSRAIINGLSVSPAPSWTAYIEIKPQHGDLGSCSGSLVTPKLVLTAAHCVVQDAGSCTSSPVLPAKDFTVYLGRTANDARHKGTAYKLAGRPITHNYIHTASCRTQNDVALLSLTKAAPGRPVWIAPSKAAVPDGADVVIYGYGVTAPGVPDAGSLRRTVDHDWQTDTSCSLAAADDLCFSPSLAAQSLPFSGDSGGPWLVDVDGQPIEVAPFSAQDLTLKRDYGAELGAGGVLPWLQQQLGIPNPVPGEILRNPHTQQAWLIDSQGYRRPIPDGGTYLCLVAQGARVVNLPGSVLALMAGRTLNASCGAPPPPPTLQLGPATGEAGGSFAATGTNFGASETVRIDFDGAQIGSATTNAQGSFSSTLSVPSTALSGSHAVVAVGQSSGRSSTAQFTVTVSVRSTRATAISAGVSQSCAVLQSGRVACWGANEYGQLGDGTTTDRATPVNVAGITNAVAVSAGGGHHGTHTCALLATHEIACWGQSDSGQLGNGTTSGPDACVNAIPCSTTPVKVAGITNATAVSAGAGHTCALLANGEVDCWGANGSGELGNGTTTNSATPLRVSAITNTVAISVSEGHSCALLSTGQLDCWGSNLYGQLGTGTSTGPQTCTGSPCSMTPLAVTGISTATVISAGFNTCAALQGGAVDCWGSGDRGQLGNGSTSDSATPVQVNGITTATAVGAGGNHACALLAGGAVECWGASGNGQLGSGAPGPQTCGFSGPCSPTPVAVAGLANAVAVTAGELHSCALLSTGQVACWGYNPRGELGNGGTMSSTTPVLVSGIG